MKQCEKCNCFPDEYVYDWFGYDVLCEDCALIVASDEMADHMAGNYDDAEELGYHEGL